MNGGVARNSCWQNCLNITTKTSMHTFTACAISDIRIEDFRYEDIVEEGLADRIAEAHAELMAYYAELDNK